MMAQTYFTITETGTYGTYKFYAGDEVPIELAVQLGIEGAELPEPAPPFDAIEDAHISSLITPPIPLQLPSATFSGFKFDSSTFLGPLTVTTLTLTANRLYAVPVRFEYPFTADYMAAWVTTPAVGNLRMGIYTALDNGFPGALIVDGGATSSNSANERSVSTADEVLSEGVYYLALVTDATATIRGFTTNTGAIYGSRGDGSYGSHFYQAQTYGALPAAFSTSVFALTIPSTAAPFLYVAHN